MGKKPVNPGFLQKKKYDFQHGKIILCIFRAIWAKICGYFL